MSVKIHCEFVGDLVSVGDADLAGRALRKCFDSGGRFIDRMPGDHRYDGIQGAWIRKISAGKRIIYIRDGNDVTLYRAGQHSVEDNLSAPNAVEDGIFVERGVIDVAMQAGFGEQRRDYARNRLSGENGNRDDSASNSQRTRSNLLYNHVDRFLYGNLLGRRFLPHKDVYLISPYLVLTLLRSTDKFGQMLDELIEGGASIWLVTRPPLSAEDLAPFNELEARGVNVFFNANLHAKVYAFTLNRNLLKPSQQSSTDFVVVGSANLTVSGINPSGLLSNKLQYELSYQTSAEDWSELERFILHVTELGVDLQTLRANLLKTKR
jgi:hypothetical protein